MDLEQESKIYETRRRLEDLIVSAPEKFKEQLLREVDKGFDINREIFWYKDSPGRQFRFNNFLFRAVDARKQVEAGLPELLLGLGANPNATKDGYTPLYISAHRGAPSEVLRKLIDAGADINACPPKGMTAISMACTQYISRFQFYFNMWNFEKARQDDLDNIVVLLKAGANPYLDLGWYKKRKDKDEAQRQRYLKDYINNFLELKKELNSKDSQTYEYEI